MEEVRVAYRRNNPNDLIQPNLLPEAAFAELDKFRDDHKRLTDAYLAARSGASQPTATPLDTATRAAMLRRGEALPPTPAPVSDAEMAERHRELVVAEEALKRLADDVCSVVATHRDEWAGGIRASIREAEAEALELERRAREARERVVLPRQLLAWLDHAADGDLHPANFVVPTSQTLTEEGELHLAAALRERGIEP